MINDKIKKGYDHADEDGEEEEEDEMEVEVEVDEDAAADDGAGNGRLTTCHCVHRLHLAVKEDVCAWSML